ncbi:hypothetical protein [Moraxella lacunata]|uniref:hypothetical protein n=1 Tax=Moraxella lacunata TaxID=477 RepID=UPI003EE0F442
MSFANPIPVLKPYKAVKNANNWVLCLPNRSLWGGFFVITYVKMSLFCTDGRACVVKGGLFCYDNRVYTTLPLLGKYYENQSLIFVSSNYLCPKCLREHHRHQQRNAQRI